MNPQVPEIPPDGPRLALEIIEFWAKAAGALVVVWGFLAKVAKPFTEWQRRRLMQQIRGVLQTELEVIAALPKREEAIDQKLDLSIERQERVFEEIDLFVVVVADGRDRIEEIQELLDAVGYASRERRQFSDRRRLADEAFAELQGRLKSRRRKEDDVTNLEGRRDD